MWIKIKNAAARFAAWYDVERRQKTQAVVAAIGPLLITIGVLTSSAYDQWALIAGAVLSAIGPLVSLVNLSRSELAGWVITSARGVLYGAAAVIWPALAALGLISNEESTAVLALLSNALTVAASVVAIFTAGRQREATAVTLARDQATIDAATSSIPKQVADVAAAAERLGLDPTEVTREAYRAAVGDDETLRG